MQIVLKLYLRNPVWQHSSQPRCTFIAGTKRGLLLFFHSTLLQSRRKLKHEEIHLVSPAWLKKPCNFSPKPGSFTGIPLQHRRKENFTIALNPEDTNAEISVVAFSQRQAIQSPFDAASSKHFYEFGELLSAIPVQCCKRVVPGLGGES